MTRVSYPVRTLLALVILAGCSDAAHPPRAPTPEPEPPAPESEPATKIEQPSEGAQALSDFQSGKLRLSAGPQSYLLGKSLGPCAALPPDRPEHLYIDYQRRPSGHVVQGPLLAKRYAIGGDQCEVLWSALHMGSPELACTLFTSDAYDMIYQELRGLAPHAIKTITIEDPYRPIHRGGYTVTWHWDDHSCELSDASDSEVIDADATRFGELVQLLRSTCAMGKHADCP